jgi:hypothetical protein
MADPAIEAGRRAWQAVSTATTFASWKAIAIAVAIGRQQALLAAGTNKPYGKLYARAINAWLEANGFREMPYGIRTSCRLLADNMASIEAWREALPADKRASLNHPEVIVRSWRRASGSAIHRAAVRRVTVPAAAPRSGYSRQVFWPQDSIRRAATALRECRSSDTFVLARAALEAAIRNEGDLIAMIPPEPVAAPRRVEQGVAA